jgi:hypothetical protein
MVRCRLRGVDLNVGPALHAGPVLARLRKEDWSLADGYVQLRASHSIVHEEARHKARALRPEGASECALAAPAIILGFQWLSENNPQPRAS